MPDYGVAGAVKSTKVLVGFFWMFCVIRRCVIPRRYIAAALRPDRDAWAGPTPCCNNQVLRRDRIGLSENLCMVVVDASEQDNIWRSEFP